MLYQKVTSRSALHVVLCLFFMFLTSFLFNFWCKLLKKWDSNTKFSASSRIKIKISFIDYLKDLLLYKMHDFLKLILFSTILRKNEFLFSKSFFKLFFQKVSPLKQSIFLWKKHILVWKGYLKQKISYLIFKIFRILHSFSGIL